MVQSMITSYRPEVLNIDSKDSLNPVILIKESIGKCAKAEEMQKGMVRVCFVEYFYYIRIIIEIKR